MINYKIYEIHEMIEYLSHFFNESKFRSIGLGEIIGADLLQMVINEATVRFEFNNILIVEGCQDYIGLYKKKIPNHIFYAGILLNELNERMIPYNSFIPKWCQEKNSYKCKVNDGILNDYSLIIVNNANLIYKDILQNIIKKTTGRCILIGDPFAIHGENFVEYPTLVDSLNKMSPIMTTARQLYGIETRMIDRNIKSDIREAKVPRRSIGKLDKVQYVTNDPILLEEVRNKQYSIKFRKGLRIMIDSNLVYHDNEIFVTNYSMGTITQIPNQTKPKMEMRLYNSKDIFTSSMDYEGSDHFLSPIKVKPANILSIEEAIHHRFNTLHLVLTDTDISVREYYSLLRITNNFLISRV